MVSRSVWSFLMCCFSSYSFREAHHVCVRGRPLWEWWGRLNYICRPHGVGTSILLWRPINKKDFGMSLLNHSYIALLSSFFFSYPLFGSYILMQSILRLLGPTGATVHSGMETGEEGNSHSWSEGLFPLSPPIQGHNNTIGCVLKAHDVAVVSLPVFPFPIFIQSFHNKLFSKSTQSFFLYIKWFG